MLTREAVVERALRYCDLAVTQGLLAIRSHVDTSDPKLVTVEGTSGSPRPGQALYRPPARRIPAGRYYRAADGVASLNRALDMGVDIVGGNSHFERTMEEAGCRSRHCAGSPPTAACRSTCIATRRMIRCRAMWKHWRPAR